MFVNLVLCILTQIIDANCIFSNSLAKLANMVRDRKVGKHTPPSSGGLVEECNTPSVILRFVWQSIASSLQALSHFL